MKNTVSFFSFKMSSRQVLGKGSFDSILKSDENYYVKNERLKGFKQSLANLEKTKTTYKRRGYDASKI
jgi:hypothetical protein